MHLELDKLELEYLAALRERTGKNDNDIIKLAIFKLHEELFDPKKQFINYIPQPINLFPPKPIIIETKPRWTGDPIIGDDFQPTIICKDEFRS